jgi:hypothetical chaperone protein
MHLRAFCGLDFGTSNSTIGTLIDSTIKLAPLENNKSTIRSAIFCDVENKEWIFGQEGIDRYLESTPGRLLMSLKSVLGSSLMNDETFIFNEFMSYTTILSKFIWHIKSKAEQFAQTEINYAVLGRPVHFHDTDIEQDKNAQKTLEDIAHHVGFKEVTFQYEPIAAALTYEATLSTEKLALIIDMGGGTSDFSVIRLHPGKVALDRSNDVLANAGIHIAGTDFDHKLSLNTVMPLLGMGSLMRGSSSDLDVPSVYYHDLTTWHMLSHLYNPKTISHVAAIYAAAHDKQLLGRLLKVLKTRSGHHILYEVETAKQKLSDSLQTQVNLEFIENNLSEIIDRQLFNDVIQADLDNIIKTILHTITLSGVKANEISALFYTGGSSKIPLIREKINSLFPCAEIIQGDAFGSVGLGLALEAERRYK